MRSCSLVSSTLASTNHDKHFTNLCLTDKYSQIYRILLPICNTLQQIPKLAESSPALRSYFDDEFGGVDNCCREILADFFRHGFDGSGAGNYFDAGSCIDGRLTSAWNWCSELEKKRFFPVFLLTGKLSFFSRGRTCG